MPERGNNRIGGAAKKITGLHYAGGAKTAGPSYASPSPATTASQNHHGNRDMSKQGGGSSAGTGNGRRYQSSNQTRG